MRVYVSKEFSHLVDNETIYRCLAKSPHAQLVFDRVNLYCVDSETVDSLCPPELRKYIDPRCLYGLKEKIRGPLLKIREMLPFEIEEPRMESLLDEIWGLISECEKTWGISVARACYINSKETSRKSLIEIELPAILVAIDREIESAKEICQEINIPFNRAFLDLLETSLVHEAFHTFTDLSGKKYSRETWYRLIEESLANYSVFLSLNEHSKPSYLVDNRKQPLEYRAWEYWATHAAGMEGYTLVSRCWIWSTLCPWPIPFPIMYLLRHPKLWLEWWYEIYRLRRRIRKEDTFWKVIAADIIAYALGI